MFFLKVCIFYHLKLAIASVMPALRERNYFQVPVVMLQQLKSRHFTLKLSTGSNAAIKE